MNLTLVAVGIGGVLDALWGDPLSRAHPVVWIGKLIAALEQLVRRVFPDTPAGQKLGGGGLWLMVVLVSTALPAGILWLCRMVSPWLALVVESVMCWQVLALKCLCQEATRVERALTEEPLEGLSGLWPGLWAGKHTVWMRQELPGLQWKPWRKTYLTGSLLL